MSRKGNCHDKAATEAIWSTLKREALADSADWTRDRVCGELFEYIEADYNRSRLHSSPGYHGQCVCSNKLLIFWALHDGAE